MTMDTKRFQITEGAAPGALDRINRPSWICLESVVARASRTIDHGLGEAAFCEPPRMGR